MLIKATDVLGLPVYTVQEGKNISYVHDIVYDPDTHSVKAFILDNGGWFSEIKLILLEDVQSIGKDAVIISSTILIRKISEVSTSIAEIAGGKTYLSKDKIVSENGINLGKVLDIYFHADTGSVEEIEVSQGGVLDLQYGRRRINVGDIVTIGHDVTIVKSQGQEVVQTEEKIYEFQGAIGRIAHKTKIFLLRVRESIQGAVSSAQKEFAGRTQGSRSRTDSLRRTSTSDTTLHTIARNFTAAYHALDAKAVQKVKEYKRTQNQV